MMAGNSANGWMYQQLLRHSHILEQDLLDRDKKIEDLKAKIKLLESELRYQKKQVEKNKKEKADVDQAASSAE